MEKPKKSQRALALKSALGGDASNVKPPAKGLIEDHQLDVVEVIAAADPVESVDKKPVEGVEPSARRELDPAADHAAGGSFSVPVWVLDDSRLSTADKIVLACLCRFADDRGIVGAPSQKVMSHCCGLTEFWTRKTLQGLESRGYIKTLSNSTFKKRLYSITDWPHK